MNDEILNNVLGYKLPARSAKKLTAEDENAIALAYQNGSDALTLKVKYGIGHDRIRHIVEAHGVAWRPAQREVAQWEARPSKVVATCAICGRPITHRQSYHVLARGKAHLNCWPPKR